jgi:outer membrane protein OmpA-like peptidoglycan-associated protein
MMMAYRVKLLGLLGLLLGACTALPPDKTEALGPVFNEDVKQGYVALASSTWDAGDWDFLHFDRKAAQATLGDQVWPDRVSSRLMPASSRETMLVQRARLVDALEASARKSSPRDAARAQVSFDCWLNEVGGGTRPDQSTGCKETFMAELDKVETRLRDLPDKYAVFFETGSALLSVPARNTITEAVRAQRLLDAQRIDLVGFADAAGSATANEALANDRALAVVEGLLQAGVPAERINTNAAAVASGGADAAQDRRVDIVLVQ